MTEKQKISIEIILLTLVGILFSFSSFSAHRWVDGVDTRVKIVEVKESENKTDIKVLEGTVEDHTKRLERIESKLDRVLDEIIKR